MNGHFSARGIAPWKEVRLESQPDRGFHPFKGVIIFSFVEKLYAGHGVGTRDLQISML